RDTEDAKGRTEEDLKNRPPRVQRYPCQVQLFHLVCGPSLARHTKRRPTMKFKSLVIAFSLILAPLLHVAYGQTQANEADAAKIKIEVEKRLADKKNHVNIELRNGTKLKGR